MVCDDGRLVLQICVSFMIVIVNFSLSICTHMHIGIARSLQEQVQIELTAMS